MVTGARMVTPNSWEAIVLIFLLSCEVDQQQHACPRPEDKACTTTKEVLPGSGLPGEIITAEVSKEEEWSTLRWNEKYVCNGSSVLHEECRWTGHGCNEAP